MLFFSNLETGGPLQHFITSKLGNMILNIKYLESAFFHRWIIISKAFQKDLELPMIQSSASGARRHGLELVEKLCRRRDLFFCSLQLFRENLRAEMLVLSVPP